MELRERILTSVLDAGFDRAGCIPLSMAGDAGYGEWIGQGMHGEMGYLARHAEAKADPATAFPLYRTVVVAALVVACLVVASVGLRACQMSAPIQHPVTHRL